MASDILEVIRGDSKVLTITFTDEAGDALDLTGSTVFFTVKAQADIDDSDDTNAVISETVTSFDDPTTGVAVVNIDSADTAVLDQETQYYYDLQVKDASAKIASTRRGQFKIIQDVTRRTS